MLEIVTPIVPANVKCLSHKERAVKFLSASEFVKFIKIPKESFVCRQFRSNYSNKEISAGKFKASFIEEEAMQLNLKRLSGLTRETRSASKSACQKVSITSGN